MTPLLDKASLRSRLRDTRGFMIAEQLTSIVFIGLLCVAVGVGLQVAMNSYASITRQAQADALLQQAVFQHINHANTVYQRSLCSHRIPLSTTDYQ